MHEAPDYRAFDLSGSHAQAGFELGLADPPFKMQPWWFAPPTARFAAACHDVVRELHPHVLDEFSAYADAQRFDAPELWRQSCRVNLKARIAARVSAEGCSTFAWHSPDGRALIGRNYDYWPMQARRQRIRFMPDCCAFASIGARGGVPCGRYDGMNVHGLFVSLHVVMTDTPDAQEVKPGVPFHLVGRIALELCHNAREARDLLLAMPHLSSLNYLLADAREAFVVEADPRSVRVLEAGGPLLAATNHFRHPDMRRFQGRRSSPNSDCRLAFLMQQGDASRAAVTAPVDDLLDYAERVMADRSAPMCGTSGALTTLWSCVAELRSRRIRYAPGAPGSTPFSEMHWP